MTTALQTSDENPTATAAGLRNHYFVCPGHRTDPIPWNPVVMDVKETHTAYFGKIFQAMEKTLQAEGLTVYLTFRLDQLPSYGPDVVAVIMDDELGRYPAYASRVRAIFKTYGGGFPLEVTPFRTPLDLSLVTTAKYARTQVLRGLSYWKARQEARNSGEEGASMAPIFPVPVGYVNQDPLPIKPLFEREFDLFFSGSISNKQVPWYSPKRWLRTPKEVTRNRMVRVMRELKEERPDLNILLDVWDSYVPHAKKQGATVEMSYSEMMMNTRICPVPRGTRLESARLYEAMRYGCVLITEPLPDREFLRGLPGIVLHNWDHLPAVVDELVGDPDRMEELHQATLQWWEENCSEEAVGRYMAEQINELLHESD
jgi:hypothetical protein